MTPDETLRALATLEAAWTHDEQAVAALAQRGPGEPTLPVLVADYGDLVLQSLVTLALGIDESEGDEGAEAASEAMRTDVTARMCTVLGRTLRTWAAGADDGAAADIARAVIAAILNFTEDADESDVLPLLTALRAKALDSA
ncbi:hypothetical protein OG871_03185 [Kitasatospora sp. NBC_00374]|uniref:hypothetical protein n=1 Tax=Kitasatospora sp. NBC_00374 TaxID=2975964 RepID=UPI0032469C1C